MLGRRLFPAPASDGCGSVVVNCSFFHWYLFSQLKFHLWSGWGPGLQPRGCCENTYDESESPSGWHVLWLHRYPGLLITGESGCAPGQGHVVLAWLISFLAPLWRVFLSPWKKQGLEQDRPVGWSLVTVWLWWRFRLYLSFLISEMGQ